MSAITRLIGSMMLVPMIAGTITSSASDGIVNAIAAPVVTKARARRRSRTASPIGSASTSPSTVGTSER